MVNNIAKNINNVYNPISFNDIVKDKQLIIHNRLYKDALSKYLIDISNNDKEIYNSYINDYKFIEINNNDNYLEPTYVMKIKVSYPFNKEKIFLGKYWNNKYLKDIQTKYENLIIQHNKENIDLSEIEYYDYINEKVQLGNKYNNNKILIKFSDLNNKIKPNKYMFYKKYKN